VAVYTLHTMNPTARTWLPSRPFENFEWTPEIARDGTIMYARWDYVDRDNMPYMSLWAMRPDGTDARILFKNYTKAPYCTFEAKPVPGSHKIVFTGSAHHAQTMGSLPCWIPGLAWTVRTRYAPDPGSSVPGNRGLANHFLCQSLAAERALLPCLLGRRGGARPGTLWLAALACCPAAL